MTTNSSLATIRNSYSPSFVLDLLNTTHASTDNSIYLHVVTAANTYNVSSLITLNVYFNCSEEIYYMSESIPPSTGDAISSWSLV